VSLFAVTPAQLLPLNFAIVRGPVVGKGAVVSTERRWPWAIFFVALVAAGLGGVMASGVLDTSDQVASVISCLTIRLGRRSCRGCLCRPIVDRGT
jgi:hypothetical protein